VRGVYCPFYRQQVPFVHQYVSNETFLENLASPFLSILVLKLYRREARFVYPFILRKRNTLLWDLGAIEVKNLKTLKF
jgi:hypothetical protein